MKISAVGQNNYNKQSFGLKQGNIVKGIIKKAYFDVYGNGKPAMVKKYEANVKILKEMLPNHWLTAERVGDRSGDYIHFMITPHGYNRSTAESLLKVPAEDNAFTMLNKIVAKLLK